MSIQPKKYPNSEHIFICIHAIHAIHASSAMFFSFSFFLFITELLTVKRLQDGGKQDTTF